jgi:CheY-like chemotaxis protein
MKRVLVVEDDPTLRRVIELVLDAHGYAVDQARNGRAALDCMADLPPDVVVADLKMPLMDGHELLERMRAQPPLADIPVILLTGNLEAARAALGADAILTKPFEPADLCATIERLTEKDAATSAV